MDDILHTPTKHKTMISADGHQVLVWVLDSYFGLGTVFSLGIKYTVHRLSLCGVKLKFGMLGTDAADGIPSVRLSREPS